VSAALEQERIGNTPPTSIPEPKLPIVDNDACPGRGGAVSDYKITRNDQMYSSYREGRRLIGSLRTGEKVSVLSGVNVIRQPDRAVMTQPDGAFLQPGDVVLGYGFHANGSMDFWAKGVWLDAYYESIVAKGSWCGFADKTQCDIQITRNGISEWWVKVKTSSGAVGWVWANRPGGNRPWNNGTFSELCSLD
jgi:hypothetical protein